jgi:tRNA threonylcarbamoyladenosine biosynthesis protein TsaE
MAGPAPKDKPHPLVGAAPAGYGGAMLRAEHFLSGPEATADLARALAPALGKGDVLLLSGEIGAGKTHFARALIQSLLAEPEDVPSPTYTLVQVYPGPGFEIWHADLYRLSGPDEVPELGLEEAFCDALCLVEWPDRLPRIPPNALSLTFSPEGEGRRVVITGGERWQSVAGVRP